MSSNGPAAPQRLVVVVSADGSQDLLPFVRVIPGGVGIAVVVGCSSRVDREALRVLLESGTSMAVVGALGAVENLHADHVYLARLESPGNRRDSGKSGALEQVEESAPRNGSIREGLSGAAEERGPTEAALANQAGAVEAFFASLGRDFGPRVVAFVLPNQPAVGPAGIGVIRRAGGLVLALTARHPAAGTPGELAVVDRLVELSEVPELLRRLASIPEEHDVLGEPDDPHEPEVPAESTGGLDESELVRLAERLRAEIGFDLRSYKIGTVSRRLLRRLALSGLERLADYLERLLVDRQEQSALVHDLFIGTTDFFRDPPAFHALRRQVIPALVRGSSPASGLRVWVPACATGEEAYSIAIELLDALDAQGKRTPLQIFATDIDESALSVARAGIYSCSIEHQLSEERLRKYFKPLEGQRYQVRPELRAVVSFAEHDLTADPPFPRMDLVSCRNVLIYLRPNVQQRVLRALHFALRTEGFLFLGGSESVGPARELFSTISRNWRIYRKLGTSGHFSSPDLPSRSHSIGSTRGSSPPASPFDEGPRDMTRRVVAAAMLPPSVVVAEDGSVLYSHGDLRPFLDFPKGETPRLDIVSVLREHLASRTRAALFKCRRDGELVIAWSTVRGEERAGMGRVRIKASPAFELGEGVVVVSFEAFDEPIPGESIAAPMGTAQNEAERTLLELEEELLATREDLRNTSGELETANEDLRASNEELTAMNEELQASNEELEATTAELRAVNDEVSRVNAELLAKVSELEEAHDDLENFFASTRLATIFLDEQLRLKRFTPAARALLGTDGASLGRPIERFASHPLISDLAARGRIVLESLESESEELLHDARWWSRDVLPYRTRGRAVQGVVVAFSEITELKQAALHASQLAAIVEGSDDAILSLDLAGRVITWNRGAERLFGYKSEEVQGHPLTRLLPADEQAALVDRLERLERGEVVPPYESDRTRRDGSVLRVAVSLSPLWGELGRVGASMVARDITEQASSRRDASRLAAIVTSSVDAIIVYDLDGILQTWNQGAEHLFGYRAQEIIGRPIHVIVPGDRMQELLAAIRKTRAGELVPPFETQRLHKDGRVLDVSVNVSPLLDERGAVIAVSAIDRDIGDRIRAQRSLERSEARMRVAASVAKVGTFEWVVPTDENYWTPEIEALYGLPPGGFEGGYDGWKLHVHPDDLEAADAKVQEALRTGSFEGEWRAVWPDGTVRWLEARGFVEKDAEGRPLRMIGVNLDITERVENARRTLRMVQSSPFPAMVHDEDGLIVAVNDAWLRLSGYRREQIPSVAAWMELAYRQHQDQIRKRLDSTNYALDEKAPEGEFAIHTADGGERVWEFYSGPLGLDPRGRRLVLSSAVDVTERKRMERELRGSEGRLRAITESTPDLIFAKDRQCRMLMANPATLAAIGKELADVLGRSEAEWHDDPLEAAAIIASDQRIMESGLAHTLEETFTSPGGTTRTFLSTKNPLRDDSGEVIGIVGVSRDVTELKRSERIVRESEARLRLALEGGELGTWVYDHARDHVTADPRGSEILGLPPKERLSLDEVFAVVHPDDRAMARDALDASLRTGDRYQLATRIVSREGELRWIRTWAMVVNTSERRSSTQLVGVVQDVTAQKRAELALEEASRRKDDYLAMLSHELRNPLAAVRTAGQLIKRQAQGVPGLARACSVLERQSAHMSNLLDGLLDVSRITRGKLTVERRPLELGVLLDQVVADFSADAERRGIRLESRRPLGIDFPVNGDPSRLQQIFENVIGNALKFTPQGGRVTVTASRDETEMAITVRDTGRGFAGDLAQSMFEPFQQGPQDLSRQSGGLGLGLALSRGLVEMHDGSIEARSDGEGKGAEFVVRLPLVPPYLAQNVLLEARSRSNGRLRILLVEDNHDSAEMLRALLAMAGHEVEVASSGGQGLELARRHAPNVILCDLGLPDGMSGLEVAQRLRDDPATRAIPLVALTGYGRPEDRERSLQAGFDIHLTKPIDMDVLSDALDQLDGER